LKLFCHHIESLLTIVLSSPTPPLHSIEFKIGPSVKATLSSRPLLMQFDINSTVSITRTRLGILESSKNKTESVRRRMFEAMAVRFICMSVVRRREVTSGYCHMGNIQSTITPLPQIHFNFDLTFDVGQAI
jgi:hypothetical protein